MVEGSINSFGLSWAQDRVREFHRSGGHPVAEIPGSLDREQIRRRTDWMREEIDEFESAIGLVDQADAIIDLIYFALGALVELGVEGEPLFDIVHRANMQKVSGERVSTRVDGKIEKPVGWITPEAEIASTLSVSHTGFDLVVAKNGQTGVAIRKMISTALGLTVDANLESGLSDDQLIGSNFFVNMFQEGRVGASPVDDFVRWSVLSEASFHSLLDESLAVSPAVVAGFSVGSVYRTTQQDERRFALIVKRSGDYALIVDPSPELPGIRKVNLDDLLAGIRAVSDGLHRFSLG